MPIFAVRRLFYSEEISFIAECTFADVQFTDAGLRNSCFKIIIAGIFLTGIDHEIVIAAIIAAVDCDNTVAGIVGVQGTSLDF